MSFMSTFLMVFAVVALLVGGFVIFNAFSITVAQRTKETAMLRAIGSSRKQVLRMIVAESVVVGVVASAIGTVLGIGLAQGLAALFTSFGVELPGGATVVAPGSIVVAMIVGTVVTVLAAYLPARRASKVAPIAAMRDVAVDSSGTSRRRAVIGTVLTGLGVALLVAGASGERRRGPDRPRCAGGVRRRGRARSGRRPPLRAHRRCAGRGVPRDDRCARSRQRGPQPEAHRGHRVGADDRRRAGRAHLGVRDLGAVVDRRQHRQPPAAATGSSPRCSRTA